MRQETRQTSNFIHIEYSFGVNAALHEIVTAEKPSLQLKGGHGIVNKLHRSKPDLPDSSDDFWYLRVLPTFLFINESVHFAQIAS